MTGWIQLEQYAALAGCLALLALGAWTLRGRLRRLPAADAAPRGGRPQPWLLAALLLLVLALAVRLLVPPVFVHANLRGGADLDALVDADPALSHPLHAAGPGAPVVTRLALLAFGWLLSDPLDVVLLANLLLALGALAATALLAARVAGRMGALAVLALAVCQPALVRIAASEDSHNAALCFGMIALAAADGARRRGRLAGRELAVVALASFLAFASRQTMFFWPALVGVVLLGRPLRPWLRRPAFWAVVLLAGGAVALRIAVASHFSGQGSNTALALAGLASIVRPALWPLHPLFRPAESLALLVLALGGALQLVHLRDRTAWALAGGAAVALASSWAALFHPGFHVEYGMRLPAFFLLLALAGCGAAGLARAAAHLVADPRLRLAAAALFLATLVAAPLPGLRAMAAIQDPQIQEYRLLRRHAATLEPGAVLVLPPFPLESPGSHYRLPAAALPADLPVVRPPAGAPPGPGAAAPASPPAAPAAAAHRYLFEGLACHAWSLDELFPNRYGPAFFAAVEQGDWAAFERIALFLWHPDEAALRQAAPPPGPRPECVAARTPTARFRPWGVVTVSRQELPWVYYPETSFPIGVWELTPVGAEGAAAPAPE